MKPVWVSLWRKSILLKGKKSPSHRWALEMVRSRLKARAKLDGTSYPVFPVCSSPVVVIPGICFVGALTLLKIG